MRMKILVMLGMFQMMFWEGLAYFGHKKQQRLGRY